MRAYAVRERKGETLLEHLLACRGIATPEAAERFLNPDYERDTHDPFLMKDMARAAERVLCAVSDNERIAVYADYDADGIPGAVVLHDLFKKLGFNNFTVYIPHRHDEGFGLNVKAVEELAAEGAALIITVDCGIADVSEVARAKELGVDVIVTDHHEPPAKLPNAHAILNPKQSGCAYPEKMLCGAGVAFKLVQALISRLRTEKFSGMPINGLVTGWEKWLLDMVGLATLSDQVPLTGENRTFARYGLAVLRKSPRPGLLALYALLRMDRRTLSEDDVSFLITPRLNAASRMGEPDDAFRLLATSEAEEAAALAQHLDRINDERKGIVAAMIKEIRRTVAERAPAPSRGILVVGNPSWRPSLLGLAASTLVAEFSCPVFLWGRDGEMTLKGSCRSDGSVSLLELLRNASPEVITDYGGHREAGGFSLSYEHAHRLTEELSLAYEKAERSPKAQETRVDARLRPDEATPELFRELAALAPFGAGNPKPLFLFERVPVADVSWFGKGKEHLKLFMEKEGGGRIPAVRFFARSEEERGKLRVPAQGAHADILAHLERSTFGGRTQLRLRIVDIL